MATISLCMIVKNEAAILSRCLDCVKDLMDEIIIVDTGSTDNTIEIAKKYTDKIYQFQWCNDFSAARNFSFSKATMDYIYAPDADEIINEENHERFRILKEALIPEVEIVQMHYVEQGVQTVLNSKSELRPKLFKRLRTFTWIDPIHETIRINPVVFDSDVEIFHCPVGNHSKRDFHIFCRAYEKDHQLSSSILTMYAKELLKWGELADLKDACEIFDDIQKNIILSSQQLQEFSCVYVRYARLSNQPHLFMKYALKDMLQKPCAEICYDLGCYYLSLLDYNEASLWFHNTCYETEAILDISVQGKNTYEKLAYCYHQLAEEYIDTDDYATYISYEQHALEDAKNQD